MYCLQKVSLFVACLCHDLDHRGTNSAFLTKTDSPLAKLYENPIIENHHFSQTIALLQMEEINIFSDFTDQDYYQVQILPLMDPWNSYLWQSRICVRGHPSFLWKLTLLYRNIRLLYCVPYYFWRVLIWRFN